MTVAKEDAVASANKLQVDLDAAEGNGAIWCGWNRKNVVRLLNSFVSV